MTVCLPDHDPRSMASLRRRMAASTPTAASTPRRFAPAPRRPWQPSPRLLRMLRGLGAQRLQFHALMDSLSSARNVEGVNEVVRQFDHYNHLPPAVLDAGWQAAEEMYPGTIHARGTRRAYVARSGLPQSPSVIRRSTLRWHTGTDG